MAFVKRSKCKGTCTRRSCTCDQLIERENFAPEQAALVAALRKLNGNCAVDTKIVLLIEEFVDFHGPIKSESSMTIKQAIKIDMERDGRMYMLHGLRQKMIDDGRLHEFEAECQEFSSLIRFSQTVQPSSAMICTVFSKNRLSRSDLRWAIRTDLRWNYGEPVMTSRMISMIATSSRNKDCGTEGFSFRNRFRCLLGVLNSAFFSGINEEMVSLIFENATEMDRQKKHKLVPSNTCERLCQWDIKLDCESHPRITFLRRYIFNYRTWIDMLDSNDMLCDCVSDLYQRSDPHCYERALDDLDLLPTPLLKEIQEYLKMFPNLDEFETAGQMLDRADELAVSPTLDDIDYYLPYSDLCEYRDYIFCDEITQESLLHTALKKDLRVGYGVVWPNTLALRKTIESESLWNELCTNSYDCCHCLPIHVALLNRDPVSITLLRLLLPSNATRSTLKLLARFNDRTGKRQNCWKIADERDAKSEYGLRQRYRLLCELAEQLDNNKRRKLIRRNCCLFAAQNVWLGRVEFESVCLAEGVPLSKLMLSMVKPKEKCDAGAQKAIGSDHVGSAGKSDHNDITLDGKHNIEPSQCRANEEKGGEDPSQDAVSPKPETVTAVTMSFTDDNAGAASGIGSSDTSEREEEKNGSDDDRDHYQTDIQLSCEKETTEVTHPTVCVPGNEKDEKNEKRDDEKYDGDNGGNNKKEKVEYFSYYLPNKCESQRRRVFFDGKLKRLSQIDAVSETFHVVFHFYLTWLMSVEEVMSYYDAKDRDKWEPEWKPQLEVENKVEGEITRTSGFKCKEGSEFQCLSSQVPDIQFQYPHGKTSWDISKETLGFDPEFAFWCRVQYNCSVTCAEELELESFPFDCQDLGVYLRLTEKANKCDVLPLPRHGQIFNVAARYCNLPVWKVPGVMLELDQGEPDIKNAIPYNGVVVRIKIVRKWQAYLSECITVFCMFWLGLATFSIPEDDVGDRLAYCITLLLADIASLLFIYFTTPKIPYQTLLDEYTYDCFIFLVIVSLLASISKPSVIPDEWRFWISLGIAVIVHAWLAVKIYLSRQEEYSKLSMHTDQLKEFIKDKSYLHSVASMPKAGVSR